MKILLVLFLMCSLLLCGAAKDTKSSDAKKAKGKAKTAKTVAAKKKTAAPKAPAPKAAAPQAPAAPAAAPAVPKAPAAGAAAKREPVRNVAVDFRGGKILCAEISSLFPSGVKGFDERCLYFSVGNGVTNTYSPIYKSYCRYSQND
jgi:predicted lipid-binding transport protein (Tim44 family)